VAGSGDPSSATIDDGYSEGHHAVDANATDEHNCTHEVHAEWDTNAPDLLTVEANATGWARPGKDQQFACDTNDSARTASYDWDFGDGYESSLQNPVHSYDSEGNKTAICTATDNNGDTYTAQVHREIVGFDAAERMLGEQYEVVYATPDHPGTSFKDDGSGNLIPTTESCNIVWSTSHPGHLYVPGVEPSDTPKLQTAVDDADGKVLVVCNKGAYSERPDEDNASIIYNDIYFNAVLPYRVVTKEAVHRGDGNHLDVMEFLHYETREDDDLLLYDDAP
jgi:hypothetical protein